jgi:hypothetical protein
MVSVKVPVGVAELCVRVLSPLPSETSQHAQESASRNRHLRREPIDWRLGFTLLPCGSHQRVQPVLPPFDPFCVVALGRLDAFMPE